MQTSMNYPEISIEIKCSKSFGGVGLFAVRNFKKGEIVLPADGYEYQQPISWLKLEKFDSQFKAMVQKFCSGTPQGFWPPEDLNFNSLTIDWYFNHSCDGNIGFNEQGSYIAIKDIKRGEELCFDYALADANPNFRIECHCGAKNCRKIITGNDWKSGAVDTQYMIAPLKAELKKLKTMR